MTNEQPLPSLLANSGKCNDAGRQENGADHPRDGSGQQIEGDAVNNLRKDSVQVEEMAEERFPVKVVGQKRRKKPYKELTLDEKVQLIRLAERCSNLSQANIAERYEIAKSNVCRILQRKDEYIRALESAGFSGSRKRKLRTIPEEEKQQPTQQQSQQRKPAAETGEEEEPGGEGGEVRGDGEFGRSVDVPGGDNDALRAHMASEHQSGRVFLCRCCNWAFRDKNELHRHLKNRRTGERSTEQRKLSKIVEKPAPLREADAVSASPLLPLNDAIPMPMPPSGVEEHIPQQLPQNLLVANFWSNIMLGHNQNNWLRELATAQRNRGSAGEEFMYNGLTQHLHFSSAQANIPLPAPTSSGVIVQTNASTRLPPPPVANGSSPSGSESELTIISSSSSASSHNSQTISPSHSSAGSHSSSSVQHSDHHSVGTETEQSQHQQQQQQQQECSQCTLLRPRLQLAQARSTYLEVYNASFQNELVRLNAKCLLAEQCIRRLEVELRQWRERNELLRYRLLECREKTLSAIQASGGGNLELSKFVGEMLKVTLV